MITTELFKRQSTRLESGFPFWSASIWLYWWADLQENRYGSTAFPPINSTNYQSYIFSASHWLLFSWPQGCIMYHPLGIWLFDCRLTVAFLQYKSFIFLADWLSIKHIDRPANSLVPVTDHTDHILQLVVHKVWCRFGEDTFTKLYFNLIVLATFLIC